jgi:hypothetical protein
VGISFLKSLKPQFSLFAFFPMCSHQTGYNGFGGRGSWLNIKGRKAKASILVSNQPKRQSKKQQ